MRGARPPLGAGSGARRTTAGEAAALPGGLGDTLTEKVEEEDQFEFRNKSKSSCILFPLLVKKIFLEVFVSLLHHHHLDQSPIILKY